MYKNTYTAPLAQYRIQMDIPERLEDVLSSLEAVQVKVNVFKTITIQNATYDPKGKIVDYYDKLISESNAKKDNINEQLKADIQLAEDRHKDDINNAEMYNQSLVRPLQDKHKELLAYKEALQPVFERFDIDPLDMHISDDLTKEEFTTLINESLLVCAKYNTNNEDYFEKYNNFVFSKDLGFAAAILGISLVALYVALPLASLPIFIYMGMHVRNMHKEQEKLKVACSLMTQVNYNRFIPTEEFKVVEDNIDTSDIEKRAKVLLDDVHDYSVDKDQALTELSQHTAIIAQECAKATEEVKSEYASVFDNLNKLLNELQQKKEELMKDYVQFPNKISDSLVMSHDYVLARKHGTIDIRYTLPLNNVVFQATDRNAAINTMKLYLCNALLSVRVKQLTIEIYDPKNMGGDFSEFIIPETKDYIKINAMPLEKLLSTYKEYTQKNIIELNKVTIDDFNKEAEEKELVPKEYKLLLLISEFSKLNENDSKDVFQEFVKFSAQQGVMLWILDTIKYPNTINVPCVDNNPDAIKYEPSIGNQAVKTFATALAKYKDRGIDYIEKFGNVFIPKEKWWTFDTIKGIKMPYGLENGDPSRGLNVAPELGDANVHALLGGATGAGKSAAINQLLISLITLYPPSELLLVYIDFKNVEAAKFTRGYWPKEQRWMLKDEEEPLRKEGKFYTRLSSIPHLKIISGTTDGEYALSVFEYLMGEMARRQEIINKYGVTKLQSMREDILDKYNKEHGTPGGSWADMRKNWEWYKPNIVDVYGEMPRLLVIFDEFQVMYNPEFVEAKVIDQINGKITAFTKLARAMGAHFWFTSQSMKGTMSKDTMGNFSLRGALRCTSDVSEELLGNPAAGTIKAKFGYMYSNDSAGQNPGANRLWRVPFLNDTHKEDDQREFRDMFDYVDKVNELLEPFNEKSYMAEFYDEKLLVPAEVLDNWYVSHSEAFADPRVFILGERANYSKNKAPVTLTLMQDSGENILIASFDREDMINLTLSVIDNLTHKDPDSYSLIMNVQDKETYVLMDVDNLVEDKFLPLASPKQDVGEFLNALEAMVTRRLESEGPFKPIFVVCVQWERAPGIGSDVNYKLQDQLKELLRKAPTVGVHFIFALKDKMELPRALPGACSHRIAGLIPKDAFYFIETPKVEKLPDHSKDAGIFAFYEFGTSLSKFRIYQHTFKNTIKSRDIILD